MKYSAVISAAVVLAQTVPSSNTCDQLEAIKARCNHYAEKDVAAHAACICGNNQEFFTIWAKCHEQLPDGQKWLDVNSATKADICGGNPSGLYQDVLRKIAEVKGLFETYPKASESSAPSIPSGFSLPVAPSKEANSVEKDVEDDVLKPVGTSFSDEYGVAEAEDDALAPATVTTSAPGFTGSSFSTPGTARFVGNSSYIGPTADASMGKAASSMVFAIVGAVLMMAL